MLEHAILLGFGSQGSAWAECLRSSGVHVEVFLPTSSEDPNSSWARARAAGFDPSLMKDLPGVVIHAAHASKGGKAVIIAAMVPDHLIGGIYRDYLAPIAQPLTLVLAHGYAVYAGDLKPAHATHELALLAPKAIGPKLLSEFKAARAEVFGSLSTHRLVAGVSVSPGRRDDLLGLARALGFAPENLVEASFEKEAIGDLISEQGLLCGGVFTLMDWTMQAMSDAGVPDGLIREECLTELELIAGLLRERGPAATFGKISQAAQCGAVSFREKLEKSGAKQAFAAQVEETLSKKFVEIMRGEDWKKQRRDLEGRLELWQQRLFKGVAQ
jgi:ketol-acid reductoisomerase